MVIVPILLTGAVLGGLYATRGPVPTLTNGVRYLFGFSRPAVFAGMSDDATLRATITQRIAEAGGKGEGFRELQLRSIDPSYVWFTGVWDEENMNVPRETQDLRGPYALAFGRY